jgi:hypothetical protein
LSFYCVENVKMQFAVYLDSLLFIYFYVLIFVFDFFREAGEKKMIHLLEKYHKDLNAIESLITVRFKMQYIPR